MMQVFIESFFFIADWLLHNLCAFSH
jgi:hypothetical protein